MAESRRPYPSDLSDAEWALLLAPQAAHQGRRLGWVARLAPCGVVAHAGREPVGLPVTAATREPA